jgi:hypothetical protein
MKGKNIRSWKIILAQMTILIHFQEIWDFAKLQFCKIID